MSYHKKMLKFVNLYYDLFDCNEFIKKNTKNVNPILDVYPQRGRLLRRYLPNIIQFINTKDIHSGVVVKELPEEELLEMLQCLGYVIGINEHTGGENFAKLYLKYIK